MLSESLRNKSVQIQGLISTLGEMHLVKSPDGNDNRAYDSPS